MPESAGGSEHSEKLTPKKSHDKGCVTKHEGDFVDDRCAYRYQGYQVISGAKDKTDLYNIDFTVESNYERLPYLYKEKKVGPFPKSKASSWIWADDPTEKKDAWWIVRDNYTVAFMPFNHNYHHILPFDAIKQLTYQELDILQDSGYNLNDGLNLIILPCLDEYGRAMMLPAHPYNHPQYNADVKDVIASIKQDVARNVRGHKITKDNVKSFRDKLEGWEDEEFWVLVDFGRSEVDAPTYPTVNNAPVAAPPRS